MVGAVLAAVNARMARRTWIWATLMAGLALTLNFVPLFDLLGYDFAFVMGLVAAAASVDIGCGTVTTARRRPRERQRPVRVFELVGEAVLWSLAILALPLLFSLLNALRVKNCNLTSGLGFYLLLPIATAIFGGAAGALCGLAFPKRGRLVAFSLPVLSVVWTLARLYFDPPVFAYDPFGGYFPGPIYDEALRPSGTLLLFRLCNLLWIAAAVTVAWAASRPQVDGPPTLHPDVRRWPRGPALLAGLLAIASMVLFVKEGDLGFHLKRSDLMRVLDGERRSPRVVLRYARAAGISSGDLDLLMEDLDFRHEQLRALFQVEPDRPITVYQFSSADEKKTLVGAGATLYAKPWTREIFVQNEQFPSRHLRHEMAHVFAASFGDPIFGVSFHLRWKGPLPFPRLASGLIEGIAEAADFTDPDGGSTTHQEAAALIADGRGAPLREVIGAGFSTLSGARAYTLAGSFCRYLLDTRGADRLKQIYRSAGDFAGVYGTSLELLESEWRGFLTRQTLSGEQRARAREQFRRPAIFKKICAREQAVRVAQARTLLATAPAHARALLEQACADDPGEPVIKVDLAQAVAAGGDPRRALELLGHLHRDGDLTAPVRARAAGLTATIQFHLGDFDNARDALREVLSSASDEGERRQATAKLRALADEPARRTLGRALFGDSLSGPSDAVVTFYLLTEFARLHPDEALGPYLIGRQLAIRDPPSAISHLLAACGAPFPGGGDLSVDFRRECLRMTMLAAYRTGDLSRSAAAARGLISESSEEAERLRARDFLARIAWRQTKQ